MIFIPLTLAILPVLGNETALLKKGALEIPPFLRGASAVLGSPQVERLAWARGDQGFRLQCVSPKLIY
jgi:hypothetical protein